MPELNDIVGIVLTSVIGWMAVSQIKLGNRMVRVETLLNLLIKNNGSKTGND